MTIAAPCLSLASFSQPHWLEHSAWLEHAPFAFWLIDKLRPRVLVELGVHTGLSYFAFCQAIAALPMPCRAFGIDTWEGDEHCGLYPESVYEQALAHNRKHYAGFSQFIRSRFCDAVDKFKDGSIDVVHFDGRHEYSDIKAEWTAWQPKLSERGVALFHDTDVYDRGFGVYRLWEEICAMSPHFTFNHCYGLGVLLVGAEAPRALEEIVEAAANPATALAVQTAYCTLGQALSARLALRDALAKMTRVEQEAELAARMSNDKFAEIVAYQSSQNATLRAENDVLRQQSSQHATLGAENDVLRQQLALMRQSTSWRLAAPIRYCGTPLRRLINRIR